MPSDATIIQLSQITDALGFERLCVDALVRDGLTYLRPLGGGGPGDGGRDAIGTAPDGTEVIAAFSLRKDWNRKLLSDLKRIHSLGHPCDRVVFVTNQQPVVAQQEKARAYARDTYGWTLDIRDVQWLSTMADLYPELRQNHAGLFPMDHMRRPVLPVDLEAYVRGLQDAYRVWREQYSPLMAEAYEFDLYALKRPPSVHGTAVSVPPQVPVTDLPIQAKVTVLLGESGSGKTATLWRIALDHSHRWLRGQSPYAPVLVDLKHWTPDTPIRHLIARAFTPVNADRDAVAALLQGGQLLLLLDGLNELPASPVERGQAQRDIHAFFQDLGEHRVVVSCRTPDFDPAFIAVDQDHPPVTYETARLTAAQVQDYIARRFPGEDDRARALLTQLRIEDRALWDNAASFVHLARLPLHLQILVEEFKTTGEVPRNKGTLLQRLIRRMGRTAVTRRAPYLDDHTREAVLSRIAHRGVTSQRYLTLPVTVARQGVTDGLTTLIQTHELPPDANVAAVWTDLLSDNYLTFTRVEGESAVSRDRNEVQWLHQTVFDYSLAQTVIRAIQLLEPGDRALPAPLDQWLATLPEILDQPCQIALGLLSQAERVVLFDLLVRQRNSLAARVLVGEEPVAADVLILGSLELVLNEDPRALTDLRHVALLRPSVAVATRLMQVFRYRSVEEKREIARVNCEFAIKYQATPAAKRALQSAHTWLGNQDEWVKFHAAQAAWGGPQKGEAGQVLQQLRQAKDPDVRRLVATLAKSWGV